MTSPDRPEESVPSPASSRSARHRRQIAHASIAQAGQERISASSVLVVGCGALGSCSAEHLARAGAGHLRLVDRDVVDFSNLQRQTGYREEDARLGRAKAPTLAEHLRAIDSTLRIEARPVELHAHNALELASGVDLIVDGTDNFATRFLLNDVALRLGIPWIYAGVVEARGMVQAFAAGGRPCLRCLLPEPPPPGALPTCETAGVLGPAVGVVGSWQAAVALGLLAHGGQDSALGHNLRIEVESGEARRSQTAPDPACPACARGRLEYLEGASLRPAELLCGRRAVQVRPSLPGDGIDLDRVAARLEPLGDLERRGPVLRWVTPQWTLTLFADGRAIFDGLTDPGQARSLYARLVGE